MWPLIKILPVKTNFRFVAFARIAAFVSVIAVIASLGRMLIPFEPPCGGLNCGIDFRGGIVLELSTAPEPVDVGAVRGTLSAMGLGDVRVQTFGDASSVMVHFQGADGASAAGEVERAKAALTRLLGQVTFSRTDVVGPKVSGELFQSGLLALGLAIVLMLLYIWFRFEIQFGVGAVVALFHDVFLAFGLIAFTGLEFSLTTVAAILTVIGYSMNDTVVVFDRLRENLRKYKRMPLREVIDLSVNETLSRTVITGTTGILALVGLAAFGGPTLFPMSAVLIFGIVIGTYSSIYIAAPVILLWGVKRGGDDEVEVLKPASVQP